MDEHVTTVRRAFYLMPPNIQKIFVDNHAMNAVAFEFDDGSILRYELEK